MLVLIVATACAGVFAGAAIYISAVETWEKGEVKR
jgi:hypothetical protein